MTTISEANVSLNSYIKEYNARFALPVHHNRSVFIAQPDPDIIYQTLAVLTPRVVDCGHCVRFQNQYYKTVGENGLVVCHRKGNERAGDPDIYRGIFCSVHRIRYICWKRSRNMKKSHGTSISAGRKRGLGSGISHHHGIPGSKKNSSGMCHMILSQKRC